MKIFLILMFIVGCAHREEPTPEIFNYPVKMTNCNLSEEDTPKTKK